MAKALIQFGSYAFSATGRTWFGRKDAYQSDAPGGVPHRRVSTWTISQIFTEPSFADNAARYKALLTALKTTEDVLLIRDENGSEIFNQRVRVESGDLPEQWATNMSEVKVAFTSTDDLSATSNPFTATYTPTGGSAVTLAGVSGWKVSIKSDRPSTAVPNRRETNALAALTGRVRADASLTPANRRAYLLAQQAIINGLDSKEGVLVYGGFSATVRVDAADADIKDGTDELEYSLALSYRKFPTGDYAECEYTFSQVDDLAANERVTTVKGKIRADDEDGARAKMQDIVDLFTTGRVLRKVGSDAQRMDGTDGQAFLELDFSVELRETLDLAESWDLTITTKDDLKTGQILITYAGSVTAVSAATALAKAEEIGDGKYPIRLTSTVTVATAVVQDGDEQFLKVTFSYEYLTKGSLLWAEVASDVNRETFGSSLQTINGFAVADTEAHAQTLARSFKPSGLLQRQDKESSSSVQRGSGMGVATQFVKIDFTYTFHLAAVSGSIKFSKLTSEDVDSREITTSWSGTAWATTEGAADDLITALLVGATGRRGKDERTTDTDRTGTSYFIQRTFSISMIGAMGHDGDDILKAEVSIETTYSIDHSVITPIPMGTPHVQTGCGITPATRVASGSITALTLSTARSWARANIISGGSAQQEAPREKETVDYYPMSGASVKAYRVEFTYGARYANLALA